MTQINLTKEEYIKYLYKSIKENEIAINYYKEIIYGLENDLIYYEPTQKEINK